MKEQQTENEHNLTNETQPQAMPPALADLEAQNAEELTGGGLTKVGQGTLILPNQSAGFYGTGVYK